MPTDNTELTVEQQTLFSRMVVDALADLKWLNNLRRLEIADALAAVFVAEPFNPNTLEAKRLGLESALRAVASVDALHRESGLNELSPERMALARASDEINDLIQEGDKTKRPAGLLGWRKKEHQQQQ